MKRRKYYYGDGTANVVRLTKKQAAAVNRNRLSRTKREMRNYNSAVDILNSLLDAGAEVFWKDTTKPLLRPTKK